jgi:hypothetical protein
MKNLKIRSFESIKFTIIQNYEIFQLRKWNVT